MPDETEDQLVRAAQAGRDDAFAELVGRYRGRAFATASRFVRNRQELEDLTQDIFIRIWKGLDGFRADAPFEHWVMAIAVRTCYDFLRKNRKRREHEVLVDETPRDAERQQTGPDELYRKRRDAWDVVRTLLEKLNEKERMVITLLELEERSVREVADLTGWSESNVKVRAHRARLKMRQLLENRASS